MYKVCIEDRTEEDEMSTEAGPKTWESLYL